MVLSPRIELGSQAPQASILSIKLREHIYFAHAKAVTPSNYDTTAPWLPVQLLLLVQGKRACHRLLP
jgi:hypothetical protein